MEVKPLDTIVFTFVAMVKYQNQKQFMEEKTALTYRSRRRLYYNERDMAAGVRDYGSRGRVHSGKRGVPAGGWRRKLRDHIFTHTQKAEEKQEAGQGYKLSEPATNDALPLSRLHQLKVL